MHFENHTQLDGLDMILKMVMVGVIIMMVIIEMIVI